MIERFVTEEFDNTEYRSGWYLFLKFLLIDFIIQFILWILFNKKGISLDDTIRIYHKFYQMCNSVSSHYNLTSKISISNEQVVRIKIFIHLTAEVLNGIFK